MAETHGDKSAKPATRNDTEFLPNLWAEVCPIPEKNTSIPTWLHLGRIKNQAYKQGSYAWTRRDKTEVSTGEECVSRNLASESSLSNGNRSSGVIKNTLTSEQ